MFYISIFRLEKLGLTLLPNKALAYFRLYHSEVIAADYMTLRPWINITSQNAFSPGAKVYSTQI